MGKETEIGWVNRVLADGRTIPGGTFNIVWGCEKVSPACRSCYAQTWANRMGYDIWGKNAPRRVLSSNYWKQPIAWNRKAAEMGEVKLVFCSSMADVFEDHPTVNQEREKLWELIDATPWLTWLLLTKRPQNIRSMYPAQWLKSAPHNVWPGISTENQEWLDLRLGHILSVPAVLRFLSCEPLLGPLRFPTGVLSGFCGAPCEDLLLYGSCECSGCRGEDKPGPWPRIGWIIGGGESGQGDKPRRTSPQWARGLRDDCERNNVPFFWKQWGEWEPFNRVRVKGGGKHIAASDGREIAGAEIMRYPHYILEDDGWLRVGKKAAGNLLDRVLHIEIPEPIKPGQQLTLL